VGKGKKRKREAQVGGGKMGNEKDYSDGVSEEKQQHHRNC